MGLGIQPWNGMSKDFVIIGLAFLDCSEMTHAS